MGAMRTPQGTPGRAGAGTSGAERSPPAANAPGKGYGSVTNTGVGRTSSMAQRVEILVRGHLDDSWADWFDGLTVEPAAGGKSVLRGTVPDQAALHGALARVRDLGLPLLGVATSPETTVSSETMGSK